MVFYQVICFSKDGKFCRAASDGGLELFAKVEEAEALATEVKFDPRRSEKIVSVLVYEAKEIKRVL